MEIFTPKIIYKPGRSNVARLESLSIQALSRIRINDITNSDRDLSEQSNSRRET